MGLDSIWLSLLKITIKSKTAIPHNVHHTTCDILLLTGLRKSWPLLLISIPSFCLFPGKNAYNISWDSKGFSSSRDDMTILWIWKRLGFLFIGGIGLLGVEFESFKSLRGLLRSEVKRSKAKFFFFFFALFLFSFSLTKTGISYRI